MLSLRGQLQRCACHGGSKRSGKLGILKRRLTGGWKWIKERRDKVHPDFEPDAPGREEDPGGKLQRAGGRGNPCSEHAASAPAAGDDTRCGHEGSVLRSERQGESRSDSDSAVISQGSADGSGRSSLETEDGSSGGGPQVSLHLEEPSPHGSGQEAGLTQGLALTDGYEDDDIVTHCGPVQGPGEFKTSTPVKIKICKSQRESGCWDRREVSRVFRSEEEEKLTKSWDRRALEVINGVIEAEVSFEGDQSEDILRRRLDSSDISELVKIMGYERAMRFHKFWKSQKKGESGRDSQCECKGCSMERPPPGQEEALLPVNDDAILLDSDDSEVVETVPLPPSPPTQMGVHDRLSDEENELLVSSDNQNVFKSSKWTPFNCIST